MPTRLLIGALGGIGLTAGAAFALASVWFPTPIVSISTSTIAPTDSAAVLVQWTRRCGTVAGVRVCPTSHDITLVGDYGDGNAILKRRCCSGGALRDTIRFERPLCPMTLRVRAEVAAEALATVERSATGRSLWQTIRCSPMTPAEQRVSAALADSFPDGARKITTGDIAFRVPKAERDIMLQGLLRSAKTRADSAKHRAAYAAADAAPDEVRRPQDGDTLQATVGYAYSLCLLGRNRYTGVVVVLDGFVDACEAPRARWQSQRSS